MNRTSASIRTSSNRRRLSFENPVGQEIENGNDNENGDCNPNGYKRERHGNSIESRRDHVRGLNAPVMFAELPAVAMEGKNAVHQREASHCECQHPAVKRDGQRRGIEKWDDGHPHRYRQDCPNDLQL